MFVHNFCAPLVSLPPPPTSKVMDFLLNFYEKDLKQNCEHSAKIANKPSKNCEQTELWTNGRFWKVSILRIFYWFVQFFLILGPFRAGGGEPNFADKNFMDTQTFLIVIGFTRTVSWPLSLQNRVQPKWLGCQTWQSLVADFLAVVIYHPGRNYYKIIPWNNFFCNNFCNYYKNNSTRWFSL